MSPAGAGASAVYLTHAESLARLQKTINDRDEEERKKADAKREAYRLKAEKAMERTAAALEKKDAKLKKAKSGFALTRRKLTKKSE